eukprot:826365-Rhodomonas_salina.2
MRGLTEGGRVGERLSMHGSRGRVKGPMLPLSRAKEGAEVGLRDEQGAEVGLRVERGSRGRVEG